MIVEVESGCVQSLRDGAGAGEQRVLRHFAESRSQHERRHAKKGGPAQDAAERMGELRVGDRMGRSGVEGAAQLRLLDGELHRGDGILERDPAHPLAAIAQPAAQAQAKYAQ